MTDAYEKLIAKKALRATACGLEYAPRLAKHLFPFQTVSVAHALRVGRAGLFLDTGLGKTECQLEFSKHAMKATNGRSLILTPLAVAQQTAKRAERWGYEARVIRDMTTAGKGINICNYDRLGKLDPSFFGSVCLDEASILKSFAGKTRNSLVDAFEGIRFKLVATATPAPNDHMELGNYAEFLEIMQMKEMLSRWFINDTSTASQEWRLKQHAQSDFWAWMASWSRAAAMPSDLGDDDRKFVLPKLTTVYHESPRSETKVKLPKGFLFADAFSSTSMHEIKRQTSDARAKVVASVVRAEPKETWLVWVDTDYDAEAIKKVLPEITEVRGSMSIDEKETKLDAFSNGSVRWLLSKPSICGHGLDWSHCARMIFAGRSYSYETYYQAVRRCWRFGQKREVKVHLVIAEGERAINKVIERKEKAHVEMKKAMRLAMKQETTSASVRDAYVPTHEGALPQWFHVPKKRTAKIGRLTKETV